MNGAIWYSKTVWQWRGHITQMLLLLRLQLARATPALARLAAVTRTVIKLDEGFTYDIHELMLHRSNMEEFPVMHSLAYDAAMRVRPEFSTVMGSGRAANAQIFV